MWRGNIKSASKRPDNERGLEQSVSVWSSSSASAAAQKEYLPINRRRGVGNISRVTDARDRSGPRVVKIGGREADYFVLCCEVELRPEIAVENGIEARRRRAARNFVSAFGCGV